MLRIIDELILTEPLGWIGHSLMETANLVMPASCAVCSRADARLCTRCCHALHEQLSLPPLPEGQQRYLELPWQQRQIPVAASGIYANELARAILAYKDHQRYFLRHLLAPYLAASLNMMLVPQPSDCRTLLVPMPSSLKASGKRGYLPVQSLLRTAQNNGMLAAGYRVTPLLHYSPGQLLSGAQKSKSGSDRRGRKIRFIAEPPPRPGQPIVLVDDVMTTGSTLRNAAVSCDLAGFEVLGAVVLALTKGPSESHAF